MTQEIEIDTNDFGVLELEIPEKYIESGYIYVNGEAWNPSRQ